ncbi:SemiSWEET transporter [Geotalea sp. SG265]|uniref:SemiSWEET family sugar transporter n=1 Tax=Geotalea sp. SG265 TaxID=2922867 RepID=UPI001FAF1BF5|nr:SemiSWEET transporter [Geotalea sp. SG265]
MNVTYLGLMAGAITTAAAVPQVVRTYRTRQARDISIWQPVLLNVGMSMWLIYGLIIGDTPLIAANAFSIVCYSLLIIMKIVYKEDDKSKSCA